MSHSSSFCPFLNSVSSPLTIHTHTHSLTHTHTHTHTHSHHPVMFETLRESKIDSDHWVGILQTGSAVVAIVHGHFPDIMENLWDSKIDSDHWVGILMSDGVVNDIVRGVFPSLLNQLTTTQIPVEEWNKILTSGTTVKTISGETDIQDYANALTFHGITDIDHVRSIVKNTTTTRVIRDGVFPTMVVRLEQQSRTIPRAQWYHILSTLTPSKTLLDNTFGDMIDELHKTTIHPQHFYKILSDSGSSKLLMENKSEFHRVLKDLTDSGFRDETLHTIICTGGFSTLHTIICTGGFSTTKHWIPSFVRAHFQPSNIFNLHRP